MARDLKSLHFHGYRAFRDFRISDLGRVNLIVGRNNAGKTSVLEAIRLLASGGDPTVLYQIATERGETLATDTETSEYRREISADISHFFCGHVFGPGSEFKIDSGNGLGSFSAEIVEASQVGEKEELFIGREGRLFDEIGFERFLALRVRGSSTGEQFRHTAFAVSDEGGFQVDSSMAARIRPYRHGPRSQAFPTVVITPSSLQPSYMANMWERITREKRENDAIEALRILQPDIEDVQFLPGERVMRARGGVLIGIRNAKRRVPLGSMGEGMRRILALAISLAQARRGFLLVDEIDTGLHWSVMGRMWELTVRTAKELGVQVFATTHSLDCLRGLKASVDENDDLAKHVRVHKVDTSLKEAVTFSSNDLAVAIDQEIEVRG
jgi:hypothetical protein